MNRNGTNDLQGWPEPESVPSAPFGGYASTMPRAADMVPFSMVLAEDEKRAIDAAAAQERISVAAWVRRAIRDGLVKYARVTLAPRPARKPGPKPGAARKAATRPAGLAPAGSRRRR